MRTNVVLDDELVREAFRLTGLRTKRELILDHAIVLLHRDRDFEMIATIRPLRQARLTWS